MTALRAILLVAVAGLGVGAVATRDPARQVFVLGALGLALAALFRALEAPDVALSQIVVGAAITPALFVLALAKVRRRGG
ncbi:MAG TPA: hydrogenase subunit MbhD domain-containing protein [Anaeromyxobacter sp.]